MIRKGVKVAFDNGVEIFGKICFVFRSHFSHLGEENLENVFFRVAKKAQAAVVIESPKHLKRMAAPTGAFHGFVL